MKSTDLLRSLECLEGHEVSIDCDCVFPVAMQKCKRNGRQTRLDATKLKMNIFSKWASMLILLAISITSVGCGGAGDRPELGYVKGTVKMDGKPLSGVLIYFKPEEGRPATATTDSQGNYELLYRYGVKGAKTGPNTISFEWPLGEAGQPIPEKYGAKSTLKEEVEAGNNVFDFDLSSK